MSEESSTLRAIYSGWQNYQELLVGALQPLNQEQLSFRSAPHLRTIEEIATHMIGARGRWFGSPIGDGDNRLASYSRWDRRGGPVRSAAEIVEGLQYTLEYIHKQVASWTVEDWGVTVSGESSSEPAEIPKQWIIWHLIEHDLHHGGEISLTMGIHHLKAPDL